MAAIACEMKKIKGRKGERLKNKEYKKVYNILLY